MCYMLNSESINLVNNVESVGLVLMNVERKYFTKNEGPTDMQ